MKGSPTRIEVGIVFSKETFVAGEDVEGEVTVTPTKVMTALSRK